MGKLENWWRELSAPFLADQVKWRVGGRSKDHTRGMALAYIDARDVMDRLDEALGLGNWQTHVTFGPAGQTACTLSIRIWQEMKQIGEDGESEYAAIWIARTDVAGETDVEGAKGGSSDALKRVAVQFGVARYLYRLDSPWVDLQNDGKQIADHEYPRLRSILMAASGERATKLTEPASQAAAPAEKLPAQTAAPTPSEPQPQAKGPKVTERDVKALYAANFQALQNLGYSKDSINKMSFPDKFAPLDYALATLGLAHVKDTPKSLEKAVRAGISKYETNERVRLAAIAKTEDQLAKSEPEDRYNEESLAPPEDSFDAPW